MFTRLTVALVLGCMLNADVRAAKGAPPPLPAKIAVRVKAVEAKLFADLQAGKLDITPRRRALLKLHQKAWGDDSPHLAQRHFDLAAALMGQMRYVSALKHYATSSRLFEVLHGRQHQQVATALQMKAIVAYIMRDFESAERAMRDSMAIRKALHGEDSVMYATYLGIWATVLRGNHQNNRAERLLSTAVRIIERRKGASDPSLIGSLYQLGWMYYTRGDFKRGDATFVRVKAIQDTLPPTSRSSTAQLWTSVGQMNQALGRADVAKRYFSRAERALKAEIAALRGKPSKHRSGLNQALASLARLYAALDRLDEARKIFQELLTADPAARTTHLSALARIAAAGRDYDRAAELFRQVIELNRKKLGPIYAIGPRAMLAHVLRSAGKYRKAFKLLTGNMRVYAKTVGARHPFSLIQSEVRASLRVLMGQTDTAIKELTAMHALLEPYTRLTLAVGTESDNRQYLATLEHQLATVLTIHQVHAPKNRSAGALALKLILERKGRLLDSVADVFESIRRRMTPSSRALLDRLRAAKGRLSKMVIRGLGKQDPKAYQRKLADTETEVRRLEEQVRARSAEYRAVSTPVTVEAVAAALPKDGVLVEFVAYRKLDLQHIHNPAGEHYVAYVLDPKGAMASVGLGPRKAVDTLVARLRSAMADPSRDDARDLAKEAYKKIFKPLEPLLKGRRKVIISPDAELNLVPFAALLDDAGRFLIQRFLFSYLGSGRDLLRAPTSKSRAPMTIIANPNFDRRANSPSAGATPSTSSKRGRISRSLAQTRWQRLPGTAAEARAVATVFPGSVVRTGSAATETALKELRGPRILHIATHGFFLPDERAAGSNARTRGVNIFSASSGFWLPGGSKKTSLVENPLLRSGLALDGANQLESGLEDGVLTALEASDLDLHGTQLVVLSACETGVGEVKPGDGVHGLRRALVIAGAESLVMTLWQVDDEATKTLMIAYYNALKGGAGRAEALRQVQLKLLRRDGFAHPFFWAAFIASGRWQPLSR